MKLLHGILLALVLTLAGCRTVPDEHGADTAQTFDADGNPNFGPRRADKTRRHE